MKSNQYELEILLITALWSLPSMKLDYFKDEQFFTTLDIYRKVKKYRADGYAAADVALSMQILGNDITKELMQTQPMVVEVSIPHYIQELNKLRYAEKLYRAYQEANITEKLLEEGVSVYKKATEDGNLYNMTTDLQGYSKNMEDRIKKKIPFYELGYKGLDRYISPIEPGTFIIFKALKKTGKTNFAINVFVKMINSGIPCIYITSEMGYYSLMNKIVAIQSSLTAVQLRKGELSEKEQTVFTRTLGNKIYNKNGMIYVVGMFDSDKISELINSTGAKIIFVDYVQMFRIPGSRSKAEELETIAVKMKDIAMTKEVAIIGMSQVNKDGDTKHCLSFEEKADQVISIKTTDDTNSEIKLFDVSVDLNRHNSCGMTKMVMIRRSCLITEMEGDKP